MRAGSLRRFWFAVSLTAALVAVAALSAQTQYARGQDVAPTFEGWEPNPDGSFSMVFGYLNRNYQEEVDIPIGPNNNIDTGQPGSDHGQPTHFYPRRQRFVFRVPVPKDFDRNRRVVWTIISRGKTNQAKGWMQPEWELNDGVIAENTGGGVPDLKNKSPLISGDSNLTVTLPAPATLTVTATDDGLPLARAGRVSVGPTPGVAPVNTGPAETLKQGVKINWIQYRGPGQVSFDPDASPLEFGKPVTLTSKVTFSTPGTYVLRATATDGQAFTHHQVSVTVQPRQ